MSYVNLSYRFFGNFSRSLRPYFIDVKEDLQKANMNYTLEEYMSVAMFTTIVAFFIECVFLSFLMGMFVEPALSVVLSLILASAISGVLFFIFYTYPVTVAKTRENKIRKVLPFAVSYLATMSSSKVSPIILFKTLSRFKEYGHVAEEAGDIANSVDLFGLTSDAAIRKQAKKTPSKELRELLWGINTVISTGGDLTDYLNKKSEDLMSEYRRRIRKYSQDLSLYVEIYLTLIITGSIFFIVLSSIIAALSAGLETVVIQTFVVFILLPLMSIAFIVLIKSISPLE
ncbi:MAG: type II secretion system F family protein [Candidatus Aenigmarchaeota archaeon]|nr:type II secretion system F family protein [Candidatus Aenigmarchaeota archaeon]